MLAIIKQSILDFGIVLKGSALAILFLLACLFVNIYFFLPDINKLRIGVDIATLVKLNIFIILYIFIYLITLLIVGYELIAHKKNSFIDYSKSRFVKLLTDLIKAYNQILILSLLIIPGIYRYIRLIFVPFISMEAEPGSKEAKLSSLKESSKLTKSVQWFVILLIIYVLFIPLDVVAAIIPNDSIANILILSVLSLSPLYYHCLILNIYRHIKGSLKSA